MAAFFMRHHFTLLSIKQIRAMRTPAVKAQPIQQIARGRR
jgi:hypothetical protein